MTVWGKSIVNPDPEAVWLVDRVLCVPGTFFAGSGWRLKSFELYIKAPDSVNEVRIAVYRGGVSALDMTGATLVEDLFLSNSGSANETWWTVNSALKPALNGGERIWLCVKGDDTSFAIAQDGIPADRGNLSTIGVMQLDSVSSSEAVSWPASIGEAGTILGWFPAFRINVDVEASASATLSFPNSVSARANAVSSCSSSLTFDCDALSNPAKLARAASSLIFRPASNALVTRLASASTVLTFANNATPSGAPNPCWDVEGCHAPAYEVNGEACVISSVSHKDYRFISASAELTATVSEV